MKKMTPFEKFGLAGAMIIGCSFFYMKHMYDPQTKVLKKTLEKRNKIVTQLNEIKDVPSLLKVKKQVAKNRKERETLKNKLNTISMKMGSASEITALLSRINGKIEAEEIQVNSITPEAALEDRFCKWSPYRMDLTCPFQNFMSLLLELKEMGDVVEIEEVVMEKHPDQDTLVNITFLMKI